jgi:hypothetical protein
MLRNIRSIEQGAIKLLDYRARQSTLLGSTDGVCRERNLRLDLRSEIFFLFRHSSTAYSRQDGPSIEFERLFYPEV